MKTLYFGGPILTMSDPLYVQAVLVEGGNILAAGQSGPAGGHGRRPTGWI